MFCRKCGKQTFGNNDLCDDCKAAENAVKPVEQAESEKTNVSMLSFGKALASTITGFGVFIVSSVLNSSGAGMNLIAMIFMAIVDIAAIVLAIVFGSMAIRTYGSYKGNTVKKPTPAFVMGILGVVLAGIATVIVLVFLFVELPVIVTR